MYITKYSRPRYQLEVSGKLHAPTAFTTGEKATGTNSIGGWVDPGAVLYDVERRKILPRPGLETPTTRPSNRIQSLYRLRFPGCTSSVIDVK
jgi:hypothetical protein